MSMRQRKEIQEVLRGLTLTLTLGAASLGAALLPEKFAEFQRFAVAPIALEDRPLWDEFGFEEAERAEFSAGGRKVSISAYRMKDPTGAFAAFQWLRPGNAKLLVHNNYLIGVSGNLNPVERQALFAQLPHMVRTSPPPLTGYLPSTGRVANSERYVLGPASLSKFEPRISASLAAFDRGAEAQFAEYRSGRGPIQLGVFSYPTPQMAMERLREFEKLTDAVTRRSGPMVVVAFPKGPEAEKLASEVGYAPKLSWTERVAKDTPQDAAKMILAIMVLAGILIAASILMGMIFGGLRIIGGRFGIQTANRSFTTLNIDHK